MREVLNGVTPAPPPPEVAAAAEGGGKKAPELMLW